MSVIDRDGVTTIRKTHRINREEDLKDKCGQIVGLEGRGDAFYQGLLQNDHVFLGRVGSDCIVVTRIHQGAIKATDRGLISAENEDYKTYTPQKNPRLYIRFDEKLRRADL